MSANHIRCGVLVAASWLLTAATVISQTAAPQPRTVWNGVFTAEQAADGQSLFELNCAQCHGENLQGTGTARPLAGVIFMRDWSGDTLSALFERMRSKMPLTAPGSLPEESYRSILAFVLSRNGFPAGETPVPSSEFREIWVQPKSGPAPVPAFVLANVVGCLAADGTDGWVLTRATEPVRNRDGAPTPEQIRDATAASLGTLTVRLTGAPRFGAAEHQGRRVLATGLLLRPAGAVGLQLTFLTPLASCAP